jgi:predicted amino acid-binding ACT domain protein
VSAGERVVAAAAADGTQAWVVLVRGEDRPGTLTAVTAVFSDRGVSFDSLATGGVDGDVGTIAVTFQATPRRQAVLVRTVGRLAAVRDVDVRRADDPAVRAAGVIRMPAGAAVPGAAVPVAAAPGAAVQGAAVQAGDGPSPASRLQWTGDPAVGGPLLVEGPLADVAAVVRAARDAGATTWATVVLGI